MCLEMVAKLVEMKKMFVMEVAVVGCQVQWSVFECVNVSSSLPTPQQMSFPSLVLVQKNKKKRMKKKKKKKKRQRKKKELWEQSHRQLSALDVKRATPVKLLREEPGEEVRTRWHTSANAFHLAIYQTRHLNKGEPAVQGPGVPITQGAHYRARLCQE